MTEDRTKPPSGTYVAASCVLPELLQGWSGDHPMTGSYDTEEEAIEALWRAKDRPRPPTIPERIAEAERRTVERDRPSLVSRIGELEDELAEARRQALEYAAERALEECPHPLDDAPVAEIDAYARTYARWLIALARDRRGSGGEG